MATFYDLPTSQPPACGICGCTDVRLDYFDGDKTPISSVLHARCVVEES